MKIEGDKDIFREEVGKIVRETWILYCREIGDPKESNRKSWKLLDEKDKEADRKIGVAVGKFVESKLKIEFAEILETKERYYEDQVIGIIKINEKKEHSLIEKNEVFKKKLRSLYLSKFSKIEELIESEEIYQKSYDKIKKLIKEVSENIENIAEI